MYKIGWFSSGRGEGSRALLRTVQEGIEAGRIRTDIEFVFCNRERGLSEATDAFLDEVESYGLPLVCISSRKFRASRGDAPGDWRVEYDRRVMELLERFQPDICILAGYMLIVGAEMCRRYDMINLHPAAPGGPEGTWREVIWKLIDNRATETGVMMHLVTPELDKGPPVTFCTFPIRGEPFDGLWDDVAVRSLADLQARQGDDNPLFRAIRQEGVRRELPLIVATIRAFSEGRVRIQDGRVIDSSGKPVPGYSLTPEIEEIVGRDIRD
jgi:folate-dependent phosphoribosylglycinamide formyltransferase PurN